MSAVNVTAWYSWEKLDLRWVVRNVQRSVAVQIWTIEARALDRVELLRLLGLWGIVHRGW